MSRRHHHRRTAATHARGAVRAAAPQRLPLIDGLRGFALCLMLVYHLAFDLVWFRVIRADFNNDPFWLGLRGIIVALFLALVGVSLVLAHRAHPGLGAFWRRVAIIAACAVLVSTASYLTFRQTFITFGILHCIALSSVLAWPLVRHPLPALIAGIAIVAIGVGLRLAFFDVPWLNWVGMMTHKPATEDYVPLVPWLGVVLIGVAAGGWLARNEYRTLQPLSRAAPAWLNWLGRHSLLVYMVHQPVLLGLLRVLLPR